MGTCYRDKTTGKYHLDRAVRNVLSRQYEKGDYDKLLCPMS